MRIAIEPFQSGPRAGNSNPVLCVWRHTWTIIFDFKSKHSVITSGADNDSTWRRASCDPVTNGIFDQRLEEQIWCAGIKCVRRDIDTDDESVGKSCSHNFQIAFQKLQLPGQWNF